METTQYHSNSTEETKSIAANFVAKLGSKQAVALRGDLGAGKTTFVQGLLEAFGAEKPYVSPTFVIMKQYDLATPSAQSIRRIYHIDAYRINDPSEMKRLGCEEWFSDPEGLTLIEWPEKIAPLLPETTKNISFRWISDAEREIVEE